MCIYYFIHHNHQDITHDNTQLQKYCCTLLLLLVTDNIWHPRSRNTTPPPHPSPSLATIDCVLTNKLTIIFAKDGTVDCGAQFSYSRRYPWMKDIYYNVNISIHILIIFSQTRISWWSKSASLCTFKIFLVWHGDFRIAMQGDFVVKQYCVDPQHLDPYTRFI